MNKRHVILLSLILTVVGLGLFAYKTTRLGYPLTPETDSEVWRIEARVQFRASGGPVKVDLKLPTDVPGFAILDEHFVSRGWGRTTRVKRGNRVAQWAIRRARGVQTLYYRADVYREPASVFATEKPDNPSVPQLGEPYDTALETLITDVRAHSADIATFTAEMLERLSSPETDENVDLLLDSIASPGRATTASILLAGARIPTQVAHGIELSDQQRNATFVPWLQVHDDTDWLYFDPERGDQRLPRNFFVWWRGNDPLVELEGARNAEVEVAVQRSVADALTIAERRAQSLGSKIPDFSLLDLPIQTQAVYGVLLMIPLGAFVIVILRNIIGIKTFGTFMPVLIAIAFRETQLLGGLILFTTVVVFGLAIRFYFERLRLLLVPRLSSVLIVVVLLMLGISLVSNQLRLESGLSIALFPMVIITMVIERMSVIWEERGPSEAIIEGIGSLFAAAIAYLVMGIDILEHLVFLFPELLLVVLAITLLLGRYSGYRLLELVRFRELAADKV